MPASNLPDTVTELWSEAGALVAGLWTPTLRLGVTGLARSGKTVLITSLIRNLVTCGRLPFFEAHADGRIVEAHLEPQPNHAIPRFDYEAHIRALEADPPRWPESTRRISEVRVAITFTPGERLRRLVGSTRRVNLDIVDYPGEWLIDLSMLGQTYAEWSADAISRAREPARRTEAAPFLEFLATLDPTAPQNEQTALIGTPLFKAYLSAIRAREPLTTVGPGRFLMPGDLEGAPLLEFFPLAISPGEAPRRGSLAAMMAGRYESYLAEVVRPFFRDHFSRLDRQIVLVDALGALNGGPDALRELERSLDAVLKAFRPGLPTWFSSLIGHRRVDRLLFAATKADHLHHASHDRLEAILRLLTERAGARAMSAGADVRVMALAALRSTREAEARDGKATLPCIVGVPLAGETVAGIKFDGHREAAVFPGDLPADPSAALAGGPALNATFPRFRPARLLPVNGKGEVQPAPHIRLDRALDYLLGDWLA